MNDLLKKIQDDLAEKDAASMALFIIGVAGAIGVVIGVILCETI